MKQSVTIRTAVLQKTLANVERIIRPAPLLPVCAFLNIVCEGTRMTVTGTDCQGWLVAEIDLPTAVNAHVLIDAKKLAGAVSTANTETVTLTFEESPPRLVVKSGRSVFRLASAAAAMEFPGLAKQNENPTILSVNGPTFAKALRKVSFACAKGDIRHFLNGVALQTGQRSLNLVGTNGHQLAKTSFPLPDAPLGPVNVIIAVEYLALLGRLCESDNVTLTIGGKLEVKADSIVCQIPLLEGQFPDWRRVVPLDNPNVLTVDRLALSNAINRVSYCMNEKQKAVSLKASLQTGLLTVRSQDEENQVEDEIEATNSGLEVSLSHVYLKDVISSIESDTVTMKTRDAGSSVLFLDETDKEWLGVIMPLRV